MIEHPWEYIKVSFMRMDASWLGSTKVYYQLHVTDIRRFIEWTESNYPEIEIQARYLKMEKCEKKEQWYSTIYERRPIIKDFIAILGSPKDVMLFKLACPFPPE